MRWVGIDEAGYGPNLGPMVMTAVVAESTEASARRRGVRSHTGFLERSGGDRRSGRRRSGSALGRRFEGDSITAGRAATGSKRPAWRRSTRPDESCPAALATLIEVLGAGTLADVELTRWIDEGEETLAWPLCVPREAVDTLLAKHAA